MRTSVQVKLDLSSQAGEGDIESGLRQTFEVSNSTLHMRVIVLLISDAPRTNLQKRSTEYHHRRFLGMCHGLEYCDIIKDDGAASYNWPRMTTASLITHVNSDVPQRSGQSPLQQGLQNITSTPGTHTYHFKLFVLFTKISKGHGDFNRETCDFCQDI